MSQEPVPSRARELQYRACELSAEREAARWLNARARGPVHQSQDDRMTAAIQALRRADRRLRDARKREARAA